MAIETPPTITPAPTPAPQRGDRATFSNRVDAFVTWLTAAVAQFGAVASNVYNNAVEAFNSATSATSSAQVASQSRMDALAARDIAVASASTASTKASEASDSAASALASANAASAIQGIPSVAGKALNKLRVNAAATGIEWVEDASAYSYQPVEQGGGIGQATDKLYVGWGTDAGLKATVNTTDLGFIPTSSTNGHTGGTYTFGGKVIAATSFVGAFTGNGANITGLTGAQINGALGYTPANQAAFVPGGVAEVGYALDMHNASNANDYDARIYVSPPTGGNGTSNIEMACSSLGLGAARIYSNGSFSGNGANLTGFTASQINTALGYVAASSQSPTFTGGIRVGTTNSNFDSSPQATLTLANVSGSNLQGATMQFERTGFYAIKAGLDNINTWGVGGLSAGNNTFRFYSDVNGNLVAAGNVTAYSDIRLKADIERLTNVVEKLLGIDLGGFEYIDVITGTRKYGVSAQAVQRYFPHAVVRDANGFLSVAYGQLALACLVEVTHYMENNFKKQQQQIDKINQILGV